MINMGKSVVTFFLPTLVRVPHYRNRPLGYYDPAVRSVISLLSLRPGLTHSSGARIYREF